MDPDITRSESASGAQPLPYDLATAGSFDGVVVASPTIHHRSQVDAALAGKGRILVEKPLAMNVADADHLAEAGQGRVMVGYNLRLHEPVERFVTLVRDGRCGKALAGRLWFGSYLPDWRPAVDYRSTYSAQAALGGGILFDAIHELDLALWLFGGDFRVVGSIVTRIGGLEIDVEDTVVALLQPQEGPPIEISLDYLSRRYRRGIEVVGSEATMRLDWARGVIEIEDARGVEVQAASSGVADSYKREAGAFLAFVCGEGEPPVDAAGGAASVRLAEAIRQAAQ